MQAYRYYLSKQKDLSYAQTATRIWTLRKTRKAHFMHNHVGSGSYYLCTVQWRGVKSPSLHTRDGMGQRLEKDQDIHISALFQSKIFSHQCTSLCPQLLGSPAWCWQWHPVLCYLVLSPSTHSVLASHPQKQPTTQKSNLYKVTNSNSAG